MKFLPNVSLTTVGGFVVGAWAFSYGASRVKKVRDLIQGRGN